MPAAAVARATASSRAHPTATTKEEAKAVARRALSQQVRRNPRAVLKRGFIHKAQTADLQIPAVVSLGAAGDDQVDVTYDTSVFTWPQAGPGFPVSEPPPAQTLTLTGSFGMQMDFGDAADGYGILGAVETTQGQFAGIETSPPLEISRFALTCSTNDNPCTGTTTSCPTEPELTSVGSLGLTAASTASGLLELFGDRFRGTLKLRSKFGASRRSACGATPVQTTALDSPAVLPLSFDGTFRISPAVTTSGRIRLGTVVVADPSAQRSNFALLHACTGINACDEKAYPLRLQLRTLTADVLIGPGTP